MTETKDEIKLSKNTIIVYKVFKDNPLRGYNANEIMELISKHNNEISERTVYRAIERLVKNDKIFCNDIVEGHRQYKLSNMGHFALTCKSCGSKIAAIIQDQDTIAKKVYERYKFDVLSFSVEYHGICNNFCDCKVLR